MSSPFWSFDPFIMSFPILLFFSSFLLFPPLFFSLAPGNTTTCLFLLLKKLMKTLFPSMDFFSCGVLSMLASFFILSSLMNLLSLFSYVFSPLAHVMLTMLLSTMMWAASMLYQLSFFLGSKIMHMTPKGTPMWLILFMVIIEMISQLIRPVTLGIRLAANITAGHLILTLLSAVSFSLAIVIQIPLIILEVVVSMVQPFVFCLLTFLYFLESYFFFKN